MYEPDLAVSVHTPLLWQVESSQTLQSSIDVAAVPLVVDAPGHGMQGAGPLICT